MWNEDAVRLPPLPEKRILCELCIVQGGTGDNGLGYPNINTFALALRFEASAKNLAKQNRIDCQINNFTDKERFILLG